MQRLLFILSVSIGTIALGYLVRVASSRTGIASRNQLLWLSKYAKLAAFFLLNPVAIISTFWKLSLQGLQVAVFPVLGSVSLLIGGTASVIFVRLFKFPPKRAASVFTSGMFTNLLTFGGLISYVLFSDFGYLLAQLYNMLVSVTYYLVGYPVSSNIARGEARFLRLDFRFLRRHKLLFVPPAAIAVGLLLNVVEVTRPEFLDPVVGVLVPFISGVLGFSIGLSLSFSKIAHYKTEIALVMLIKFVIVPAVMIPIGLLLGLHAIAGGVPMKVLTVLSFMPVAFHALVPPVLFGFDLDLANSAWIATTASLILILPVLYFVLV